MLRGTYKKRKWTSARPPTLQNQVTRLARQVNSQKPETQYLRRDNFHAQVAALDLTNYLISQTLTSSSDFRDNVTGDTWTNLTLRLHLHTQETCKACRVVVYVAKKAGQRWAPSGLKMVEIPDRSKFWVIADTHVPERNYGSGERIWTRLFNLSKMKTIFDSENAEFEKGELVVAIVTDGGLGTYTYHYGYELAYHNN